MSIVSADIVAYASLNMPTAETGTAGGGIDVVNRVVFTDLAANDKVEVLSSAAGDTTQMVAVTGRLATGALATETLALNGTSVVQGAVTFERIEKVLMDADAVGIVTVRRFGNAGAIGTIPIAERGFQRLFISAYSDPSSGKDYYTKIFIKNAHATLAFLNASIVENADPTTLITFALEDAVNDTHTVTNRLTAPIANVTAFNNAAKNVPGTDLGPGARIGTWVKMSLAAAQAAFKSTWTVEADGQTV